jgi:hypothetical protein
MDANEDKVIMRSAPIRVWDGESSGLHQLAGW